MSVASNVAVQARGGDELCPYCRERLRRGERVLVCEGCQAPYHEDCMRDELGRCATLGCAGTRALPRTHGLESPASPAPVVVARAEPAPARLAASATRPPPLPPDRHHCTGCHAALRAGDELLVCTRCRAAYHAACAARITACSWRACGGVDARRAVHLREDSALSPFEALGLAGVCVFVALVMGVGAVKTGSAGWLFGTGCFGMAAVSLALHARTPAVTTRFGARLPREPASEPAPAPAEREVPCATCARPFARGEPLLECEGCRGRHHAGCLRQAGRCQVAGCVGARAVPRRAR